LGDQQRPRVAGRVLRHRTTGEPEAEGVPAEVRRQRPPEVRDLLADEVRGRREIRGHGGHHGEHAVLLHELGGRRGAGGRVAAVVVVGFVFGFVVVWAAAVPTAANTRPSAVNAVTKRLACSFTPPRLPTPAAAR